MADSCCVTPVVDTIGRDICHTCGQKGKSVSAETINALVKPELAPEGGFTDGHYCFNIEDSTIYFFSDGYSVRKEDLTIRVGFKETDAPQMVCYCFEHTKDAIQADFQAYGESRIEAAIRAEVNSGSCSCESKNPKGKCCLGDVRAAYRELEAQFEVET